MTAPNLELPPEVEEYRLIRVLGSGAMGRVYLAEDRLLDRLVAIKFIAAETPSSVARKRFFVEARAAARITHSNVVTIYRVAEFRRLPFLVSEYVRGQTLAELTRPIETDQILRIASDLARGLAAAHRRGVLHRDIKPANAMISEDGVTKLLDFGLAELTSEEPRTERPRLAGTPIYIAPELWAGAEPSPRSDVFALGVLLHELYSGEHPFGRADGNPAEARVAALHTLVDSANPKLCAVIERCLAHDPLARFGTADAVVDALDDLAVAKSPALQLPHDSPYRGLLAFGAEHRNVFFGRRSEAAAIRDRLTNERFLVIASDSGTGKSSLCRAGVLPLFEADSDTVTVTLGRTPLTALAAGLASLVSISEEECAKQLAEDPAELGRMLRANDRQVVLFIDQLEELVTQAGASEAALTAEALHVLIRGDSLRLLATARSDFLTRLAALPGLGDDLASSLSLLRPLAPERLFEVVVEPAAAMGFTFESEAMVESLIAEARVADGGLPLLQFALGELWDARDTQRKIISATALAKIGGVAGALSRHADTVVGALPMPERRAARAILLSLVTPEGTRDRRNHAELLEIAKRQSSRSHIVLDALVKGRLLTALEDESGSESAYTIAHETLLASWETLRGWLGEDVESRATKQRVERAAAEWERMSRPVDLLFSARQLGDASKVNDALTPKELEFLIASRRAVRRRRILRWTAALAVPVLVAAGLLTRQVDRIMSRDRELSAATSLAAIARVQRALYEGSRQVAFADFDRGSPDSEAVWSSVMAVEPRVEDLYAAAQQGVERILQDNSDFGDARRLLAALLNERAELAEMSGHNTQRDDLLRRGELFGGEPPDADVKLSLHGLEPIASATLQRYHLVDGIWKTTAGVPAGRTVKPGSWLLTVVGTHGQRVRMPLLVIHGRDVDLAIDFPREPTLVGFVFVPAAHFLYGSAGSEDQRAMYITQPSHDVALASYWIAENETTYGEWIEYLRSLPAAERKLREPSGTRGGITMKLSADPDGVYRLTFGPELHPYSVREGQTLHYEGRQKNASQNWSRLPVTGVSFDDEIAYATWLRTTKRVPGARPCSEREWEHAARGADLRAYPHGEQLTIDSANFDATYGRVLSAFGPDEVGSHPASDSPYGVHDLAGNVWEWTASSADVHVPVARGGCFFQADIVARSENRSPDTAARRDAFYGIRLCASSNN